MNSSNSNVVRALRIAEGASAVRHVFIKDLELTCLIGVYKRERKKPQTIRINVDLGVSEGSGVVADRLADVVCYEDIVEGIRSIVLNGHINLIETLAEQIANMCLEDDRIRLARIRVEKLEVFEDAASAGVEIERFNIS